MRLDPVLALRGAGPFVVSLSPPTCFSWVRQNPGAPGEWISGYPSPRLAHSFIQKNESVRLHHLVKSYLIHFTFEF